MAKRPGLFFYIAAGLVLLVLIELRPWQSLQQGAVSVLATPSDAAALATPPQGSEALVAGAAGSGPVASAQGAVVSNPGAAVQTASAAPATSATSNAPATPAASSLDSQPIRAQLSPVTYTTIAAELSARVQEIAVREGDNFARGSTLVVFDCSAQRAQLQKSQASLSITQRNYLTNKELLALGSVGRVEHDNSRSEYEKSRAEVSELTSVLDRCRITAPFPGKVVEQKVRSQQFVQAGQPLLEILDSRVLELEFIAPSRWAPWLTQGSQFQIEIDETGKAYPARVTRVAARIDPVSQTFKVAAVINGTFKELSSGMSGTLIIQPPKSASSAR
jgi:membrane fusion protein, multidrug efflux system